MQGRGIRAMGMSSLGVGCACMCYTVYRRYGAHLTDSRPVVFTFYTLRDVGRARLLLLYAHRYAHQSSLSFSIPSMSIMAVY